MGNHNWPSLNGPDQPVLFHRGEAEPVDRGHALADAIGRPRMTVLAERGIQQRFHLCGGDGGQGDKTDQMRAFDSRWKRAI